MGFRVKCGDRVWVCYDGKWGRRQPGTVVKASQYAVWVTFTPWASDDPPLTAQFRVRAWSHGRRWGGPGRGIGGWVPQQFWYSVRKRRPNEDDPTLTREKLYAHLREVGQRYKESKDNSNEAI